MLMLVAAPGFVAFVDVLCCKPAIMLNGIALLNQVTLLLMRRLDLIDELLEG